MSTTDLQANAAGLPVGNWSLDATHSHASFAVKHMGVSVFRGHFDRLDATLNVTGESAQLIGTVEAGSVAVKDENLRARLGSPEFFDVERYPEITFRSSSVRRAKEQLVVDGELTIKGNTHAVEGRGTVDGPTVGLDDAQRLGLVLEAVIDRTEFGLNWNAPLPKGGSALANDVKLTIELELVQG